MRLLRPAKRRESMMKWYRVNRKRPCRICRRPDWCGYSDELSICMRVESDRPTHNGGWLHGQHDPLPTSAPAPLPTSTREVSLNAHQVWQRWFERTEYAQLDHLGAVLGVDTDCLKAIGC